MNKIITALALVTVIVMLPVITLAAKSTGKWYTSNSIENSGTSGFGGLKYQKTIDEDAGVVCYTAVNQGKDVSISCVRK